MGTDKIRYYLNIIFIVLAIASVIVYYVADFRTFIYVCGTAIFVKVMEFIIRFTNQPEAERFIPAVQRLKKRRLSFHRTLIVQKLMRPLQTMKTLRQLLCASVL